MKPNVINFSFSDENITYLQLDNNENEPSKLSLWQSDFSLLNSHRILNKLSLESYQIINSPGGQSVLLKNALDENLYLVKENTLQKINSSVKEVKWSKDSRKIAYCTDSEIWTAEINVNQGMDNILVSRYSNKVNNLDWFFDNYHLIFNLNNQINIVETDGTNLTEIVGYQADRQIVALTENSEKIDIFFLNKKESSAQ